MPQRSAGATGRLNPRRPRTGTVPIYSTLSALRRTDAVDRIDRILFAQAGAASGTVPCFNPTGCMRIALLNHPMSRGRKDFMSPRRTGVVAPRNAALSRALFSHPHLLELYPAAETILLTSLTAQIDGIGCQRLRCGLI